MDLPRHAYFMGKVVPFEDAKVSVATHAFNYGTAVFGGLRGYWNDEQKKMFVFRPLDHFRRLLNSAKMMCMEVPHTPESLTEITLELLKADGWQRDIYIRPLIYKSDLGIGVRLHNLTDAVTIFTLPSTQYIKNDTSAHATVSSWRRVDDNVIPARGKVSGAYANSALIKTEAVARRLRRGAGAEPGRPRLGGQRHERVHGPRRGRDHPAGDGQHPRGHHPPLDHRTGAEGTGIDRGGTLDRPHRAVSSLTSCS